MSLELVSVLASVGTFIVIAATAIAALVQLRHLQSSNQLQAMLTINEKWDGAEISRAAHYVDSELPARMAQGDYAASLLAHRRDREQHPEILVCEFWEQIGSMVKYGLIMKKPLLDLCCETVAAQWDRVGMPIAILREASKNPAFFENFEYLAALCKEWIQSHPQGAYPQDMARLPLPVPTPTVRQTL